MYFLHNTIVYFRRIYHTEDKHEIKMRLAAKILGVQYGYLEKLLSEQADLQERKWAYQGHYRDKALRKVVLAV